MVSMPDWRPGLPSEPCVCDVRVGGVVHELVEVRIQGCIGGEMRTMHKPGARFTLPLFPAGDGVEIEWRPIPVPEGV